jgi:hypothetical protein
MPPHERHVPPELQTSLVPQLDPFDAQRCVVMSQQKPEPHVLPAQHGLVDEVPHAVHEPPVHTSPPWHAEPLPTHSFAVGSQQAPLVVHGVAPAQHAWPSAPHSMHVLAAQTPLVGHVEPVQHVSPTAPQGGGGAASAASAASSAASLGASSAPSLGASPGASVAPSVGPSSVASIDASGACESGVR